LTSRWRRFLPKQGQGGIVLEDGMRLATVRSLEDATALIDSLKAMAQPTERLDQAQQLRTLLLAQTPRAALAQVQMDKHKHGYHNREKRLFELIDFNDTFVSLVLVTPHGELKGFAETLYADMTAFCRRLDTPMFTPEQYDAIVRGLSIEIAVYRAAKYVGFEARMTSRVEDAFGIDMAITQPDTGKLLNIDCKAPPAFRHRLEELVVRGRISDAQLLKADSDQYITTIQHQGEESVPVTLLCVGPDSVGDIHDFTLDHPEKLQDLLNKIFINIR
jgi:hypothetical protein